jgi:hypothetical protein
MDFLDDLLVECRGGDVQPRSLRFLDEANLCPCYTLYAIVCCHGLMLGRWAHTLMPSTLLAAGLARWCSKRSYLLCFHGRRGQVKLASSSNTTSTVENRRFQGCGKGIRNVQGPVHVFSDTDD